MIHAISSCPLIIDELLKISKKIKDGTLLVTDVVDGILDPSNENDTPYEGTNDEAKLIFLLMRILKALLVMTISITSYSHKR